MIKNFTNIDINISDFIYYIFQFTDPALLLSYETSKFVICSSRTESKKEWLMAS